jgi:homoserine acetyltransferase
MQKQVIGALRLDSGDTLDDVEIAYETAGALSRNIALPSAIYLRTLT